jgi:protein-tyrosine phosphatase
MDFITPHIAIGSASAPVLYAGEYEAILNCAAEVRLESGVPGLHLHLLDMDPIPDRDLDRAIAFLDQQIREGRRVLVHCVGGISRSVSVVCAYLALREERSPDEALEMVQRRRLQANPDPEVFTSVKYYVAQRSKR